MSKAMLAPSVIATERFATESITTERWVPPAVQGKFWNAQREQGPLDRKQHAAVDAEFVKAQAEGFAAGRAEFAVRQAELDTCIKRFGSIVNLLSRPLTDLDAQIEQQLVILALTVARHLVRRELRIDPTQVIAIIRETVALLPAATRNVRVHLHPDDAALVRERLATPQAECAWTVIEDPVLGCGGCRVTTDNALIDAGLETRLGAAISSVLGTERADSRTSSE